MREATIQKCPVVSMMLDCEFTKVGNGVRQYLRIAVTRFIYESRPRVTVKARR